MGVGGGEVSTSLAVLAIAVGKGVRLFARFERAYGIGFRRMDPAFGQVGGNQ